MTKKLPYAAAAAALLIAASVAPAAAQDGIHERRNISVSGQGEAAGTPDMATVNLGVQTQAATAPEAAKANQSAVDRVMQALKKAGVDARDIRTSDYSIWPEQRHDPRDGQVAIVTSYRVNNTVNVTVRDIDKVGEILGAVTSAGANSIHGISFGIDDLAALEERARAAAMADARAKAEALAKLAGVELGEVLQVSLSSGGGRPVPIAYERFAAADASAAPSVSAGQHTVSAQVQVTWAIE